MNTARIYAEHQQLTAVSAASPVGLIVLAYDRLIDHLNIAAEQIALGQDSGETCAKAIDLIDLGLRASLNLREGGEIAANLNALYAWALNEILMGRLRKDAEKIRSVVRVLIPLAEAWRTLSAQATQHADQESSRQEVSLLAV
jgi:flagellar secretion chaperone FliS